MVGEWNWDIANCLLSDPRRNLTGLVIEGIIGHKEGHWVMLQNIHLMPSWCVSLEKCMDNYALEGSHPAFKLFLSADPNDAIPIGILDRSIKLTNEPPQGLIANLNRAFANFKKEEFEDRDSKVQSFSKLARLRVSWI